MINGPARRAAGAEQRQAGICMGAAAADFDDGQELQAVDGVDLDFLQRTYLLLAEQMKPKVQLELVRH